MIKQILIHIAMAIVATIIGSICFVSFVNHLAKKMSNQSKFLNAEEMLNVSRGKN